MDILVANRAVELVAEHLVHAPDDEVHHLDRGVHDAEALGHLRESGAEEFVVELDHARLHVRRCMLKEREEARRP